MKKIQFFW